MEIVKEILSQNQSYKAEIIKQEDGLFRVEIYVWIEEFGLACWSRFTKGVHIGDTMNRATEIAQEELRNITGIDVSSIN